MAITVTHGSLDKECKVAIKAVEDAARDVWKGDVPVRLKRGKLSAPGHVMSRVLSYGALIVTFGSSRFSESLVQMGAPLVFVTHPYLSGLVMFLLAIIVRFPALDTGEFEVTGLNGELVYFSRDKEKRYPAYNDMKRAFEETKHFTSADVPRHNKKQEKKQK